MASSGKETMAELEKFEIYRISDHREEVYSDLVISEVGVIIELNGEVYKTLHCLPTHLEELAKGHLVSEGICCSSDIGDVEVKRDGGDFAIAVTVNKCNPVKMERVNSEAKVTTSEIWNAMEKLDENSILFRRSGGTHVAGIYSNRKSVFAEDISRHCAIDKVIGMAFQSGMNFTTSALVTTGRQTASTVEKSARIQIPVIVSISAPTSLAIETAKNFGITLIGFARGHQFNIYSHEWRVIKRNTNI